MRDQCVRGANPLTSVYTGLNCEVRLTAIDISEYNVINLD